MAHEHDRFFRHVFGDPENAAGELRAVLPAEARLPPILPVLVCHDERRWRVPRCFSELYAIDVSTRQMLRPYLVDFTYALDDLTVVSEAELRARAMTTAAKVALFCLKRARVAEDMVAELEGWIDALREIEAAPNGRAAIISVLTYVLRVTRAPLERIRHVARALGPKSEEAMMSTLDELIEEGKAEGKAEALLAVLEARGLPVCEAEQARILACTSVLTLDRWIRRAVKAATTAEVLAQEQ